MPQPSAKLPVGSDPARPARLDTWKEIAAYLGRDVRSVQRWEIQEGLPVRRHRHGVQSSVFALPDELDAWRAGRQPAGRQGVGVAIVQNAGGGAAHNFWCEGLSEALTQRFAQSPSWERVVAHASMLVYAARSPSTIDPAQAGRELGVGKIVIARLTGHMPRLRLAVELVETRTGRQISHFRRDLIPHDLESGVDPLADQIYATLMLTADAKRSERDAGSVPVHPTRSSRVRPADASAPAELAYLKGRHLWNKTSPDDLGRAVQAYRAACTLDPNHADAWAGLAECLATLGFYGALAPGEAYPAARAAADRARALHGVEAGTAQGICALGQDWNPAAARRHFAEVLVHRPGTATLHYWSALCACLEGDLATAQRHGDMALVTDTFSFAGNIARGTTFYLGRRYREALAQAERLLEVEPRLAAAHHLAGLALEGLQQPTALAAFQRAVDLQPRTPAFLAGLGHAAARQGKREIVALVLEQLQEPGRYVSAHEPGLVHLGLGTEKGRQSALRLLEQALLERSSWMVYLGVAPRLDPLRADSRFREMIKAVGVPASRSRPAKGAGPGP